MSRAIFLQALPPTGDSITVGLRSFVLRKRYCSRNCLMWLNCGGICLPLHYVLEPEGPSSTVMRMGHMKWSSPTRTEKRLPCVRLPRISLLSSGAPKRGRGSR